MKVFIVSSLALLASSMAMATGESINKTLDADASGTVAIDVVRGHVVVEGWNENRVMVKGTLDEQTKEFVFERDGKSINIEVKLPRSMHGDDEDSTDIVVKVPRNSSLKFKGVSTDLVIQDIVGASNLGSVSGDIQANKLGQEVHISTVSGEIQLKGAGNDVSLNTVSGDITAHITAKELSVSTVSGDAKLINEGNAKEISASTVSGNVSVESQLDKGVQLSMSSVSGDLDLLARGDVNARIEANTGPGGSIGNQLTSDKPTSSFIGDEHLHIKVGDASGEISMSVVSGDIKLKKR